MILADVRTHLEAMHRVADTSIEQNSMGTATKTLPISRLGFDMDARWQKLHNSLICLVIIVQRPSICVTLRNCFSEAIAAWLSSNEDLLEG